MKGHSAFRHASGWLLGFLALAVLALLAFPAGALAQEPIHAQALPPEVRFAEKIIFRLEAWSDHPIQVVQLRYGKVGERARARATAEFTPGRQVEATYTWDLRPGDLAPGTRIEYSWHLEDEDGRAADLGPQTLVYEDDRFPWQEISRGNLALRWYGLREERAQRLLEAALEAQARLENDVGVTLSQPVHIYAYQNREDMKLALPSRSETFDDRVLTLGMAMSEDTLVILASAPDVEWVIAHELSHIVVGLATRNPLGGIPRWLDEGLAMYAEGELPRVNRNALVRAIRENRLISVRSLSAYTGDPQEVDLYYAEVYSVVDFLLKEYGRDRMRELLQLFKKGTYQEDALRQVYSLTLDELDAAWRESLGVPARSAPGAEATVPSSGTEVVCPGTLLPMALVAFAALRVALPRR